VITQTEADALDKEMEERHEKALAIVKAAEKDQTINSFSGSTAVPQAPTPTTRSRPVSRRRTSRRS